MLSRSTSTPSSQGDGRLAAGHFASLDELLQAPNTLPRWVGWRLHTLVAIVLLSCALVVMLGQWLAGQPDLGITLRASATGMVKIASVDHADRQGLAGHVITGISTPDHHAPIEPLSLQLSARWISDTTQRERYTELRRRTAQLMESLPEQQAHVVLELADTAPQSIPVSNRGWGGLNWLFWLLCSLGLMTFAAGSMVVLARAQWRNVAYFVLTSAQAGQLILMATEANLGVLAPPWFIAFDSHLRAGLDLVTLAALIQVSAMHPSKVKGWPYIIAMGWVVAAGLGLATALLPAAQIWWWIHLGGLSMAVCALLLMHASYKASQHPFTLVLQRFSVVTLAVWMLLTLSTSQGVSRADMQLNISTYGVMIWHMFFASELILAPLLSRSKKILQEFSLLAVSSIVAGCLDLLFVAVLSLGQFASMTLSLFLSVGIYLLVRKWVMNHIPGRDTISTERLFERLYRMARELERQPGKRDDLVSRLMRELFDPLELTLVRGEVSSSELRGNGSLMLVRLPALSPRGNAEKHVLVLKHSNKGKRLFTTEDARLADRVIDQLHRVLHFDQAVEQGRSEERIRIAQDLHDDIGARLLTLMYQAPNASIEEYIRHTLQDLKTLTRGLAAQSHELSEAASEWKRDLSQRLGIARCELDWQMSLDGDVSLTMVQWSALTRILRELVNNTISHAKATKVQVKLSLLNDLLSLTVTDNGLGRSPETWSHGLGLGGVRKRVKQLNGSVRWSEVDPVGIRCEVLVERFSASAGPANPTES